MFTKVVKNSESNNKILIEQTRMLYEASKMSFLASFAIAIVLVWALWGISNSHYLIIWLTISFMITLIRLLLTASFFSHQNTLKDPDTIKPWFYYFFLGALIAGLNWGMGAIFIYPTGSTEHEAFMGVLVAGLTAGAVTSLSASAITGLTFILLALVPLTIQFLLSDSELIFALGFLVIIFLSVIAIGVKKINNSIIQNLQLRLDSIEREKSLEKEKQRAEQASIAKGQFLATMSHEIRTPMNAVLGLSELLADTPLTPEQQDYVDTINRSGTALLTILNDILDFSKIEAGKVELLQEPFNLRSSINDIEHLLFPSEISRKSFLTISYDDDCPKNFIGDGGRIRQVIFNLLGNAKKFTEQGEIKILVSISNQTKNHGLVRIEIEDSGIGIEERKLSQLFDPFTQADGSTTRNYGGTGLGLAISKHLIQLMGGNIGVRSKLGEGTRFWFSLPLTIDNKKREKTDLEFQPGSLTEETNDFDASRFADCLILLVEDSQVNQKLAITMLKKLGVNVDVANNGQEAFCLYQEQRYDLIFMDCQMPVMDGYQASIKIREFEDGRELPSVPIVALTANAMLEDKKKCMASGMNDFIPKPFKQEHLKSALQHWLRI